MRRLAMQVLYQLDVSGEADRQTLLDGLDTEFDKQAVREQGVDLALKAWTDHQEADKKVEMLSPDWPTHRQPPVDRAILRLAYHEIVSGITPPKVAINEAVELAKQYASEQSPSFVNGILDKLAKMQAGEPVEIQPASADATQPSAEVWLDDALGGGGI